MQRQARSNNTNRMEKSRKYKTIPSDEEIGSSIEISSRSHHQEDEAVPEWKKAAIILCLVASGMVVIAVLICVYALEREKKPQS